VPVDDDGFEELLQPANATAATVISDQTTLRMEWKPQVGSIRNAMLAKRIASQTFTGERRRI